MLNEKDLTEMWNNMNSLELTSEKSLLEDMKFESDNCETLRKRKPSLPPLPNNFNMRMEYKIPNPFFQNTRKSLFFTERSYSTNNLACSHRSRLNSKPNIKQEMHMPVKSNLNLTESDNSFSVKDPENVYDTISFVKVPQKTEILESTDNSPVSLKQSENILESTDNSSFSMKQSQDVLESTDNSSFSMKQSQDVLESIDNSSASLKQIEIKLSPEIREDRYSIKSPTIRYSNLSEKAYNEKDLKYGNHENVSFELQSAPESARNSSMQENLSTSVSIDSNSNFITDNNCNNKLPTGQLSIDSGINSNTLTHHDHVNSSSASSINQANSSSGTIMGNTGTSMMDNHQLKLTLEDCLDNSALKYFMDNLSDDNSQNNPTNQSTKSCGDVVPNEFTLKSKVSVISKPVKTEKEQGEFFRMISKSISESSFSTKEIIRFYLPDGTFSSQIIDKNQSALVVCQILRLKFNVSQTSFCQIIEVINAESLVRPLEDHEYILDVFYSWSNEHLVNRFIFKENNSIYKIFTDPMNYENEMKCDFQLSDVLWIKESRGKWRKATCFILDNFIYFTIKPGSTDHKDLFCLVNLKFAEYFICTDKSRIKKVFKSPTTDLIVFKNDKLEHKSIEHSYIATLNSIQKEKWIEAIRIAKFGFKTLKDNYLKHEQSFGKLPEKEGSTFILTETLDN